MIFKATQGKGIGLRCGKWAPRLCRSMGRCARGSHGFLRNGLELAQKGDFSGFQGRLGWCRSGAGAGESGGVYCRERHTRGACPAQECLEKEQFPLKTAPRVIATRLCWGPALGLSPASPCGGTRACGYRPRRVAPTALGLKTQTTGGILSAALLLL